MDVGISIKAFTECGISGFTECEISGYTERIDYRSEG